MDICNACIAKRPKKERDAAMKRFERCCKAQSNIC